MPPGPKRVPAGTKKKHRFVAQAPRGTLTVTVRDGKGAAISGATVQVEQPGGRRLKGQSTAAGTVNFPSVVAGQSKITVQKEGFDPAAATVQVPAGATVGANAVLQPATATLIVRVVNSAGANLVGAGVTVSNPTLTQVAGQTDAKGQATLKNLPVGTYQVAASLDNFSAPAAKAVPVAVRGKNAALVTLRPNPVVAQITPTSLVLVLPKRGCSPARKQITLKITGPAFTGNGTFTCSKPNVLFFKTAVRGSQITYKNGDNVFTGAALAAGVKLFAQATKGPSSALQDTKLTLALSVGTNAFGTPGTAKATVVELTLDLFQSRRTAAGVPAPMSANDKIDVGRFVHEQDPGFHHGRAMLVVREVKPAGFKDPLVLQPIPPPGMGPAPGAAQLFAAEKRASGGDIALATPVVVTQAKLTVANKVAGAKGLAFFIEGQTPSSALRDTGFQLGIQGDERDGDRAVVTVVRFSNLRARIPSTAAATTRTVPLYNANANSPVPDSVIARGTAAALAAADFDEDYGVNPPLVLIENSIAAAGPINLRVQVRPAGVPVRWSALRDTRPQVAGNPNASGDVKRVRDVSPKPLPQLQQVVGHPRQATLLTDAVGSFRIRAYVDCNGSLDFDRDANAATSFSPEPYILLNLVLVRAQSFTNTSVVQPGNMSARQLGAAYVAGGGIAPTGATGVQINAGLFTSAAVAGVHNQAQVDVIGGGSGTRGLDRLFAGWVNNTQATPGSLSVPNGLDINADYLQTFPPIRGVTPPPVPRHRFMIFTPVSARAAGGAATPVPTIGPAQPAPAILPQPLLDVSPFTNEGMGGNSCVGTETAAAPGPPVVPPAAAAIVKVPIPATPAVPHPAGQRWTIHMFDSPGSGAGPTHPFGIAAGQPFFPTNLVQFRFNLNFRSDLVFWTNIQGPPFVPAPTPGPVNGPAAAAPHPACCLYASVQTNLWNIRYQVNFSPAAPFAQAVVVAPTMGITPDPLPTRTAQPATLEVRFPPALKVLAFNART